MNLSLERIIDANPPIHFSIISNMTEMQPARFTASGGQFNDPKSNNENAFTWKCICVIEIFLMWSYVIHRLCFENYYVTSMHNCTNAMV